MTRRWWIAPGVLYLSALAVVAIAFLVAERYGIPFVRLTADAAVAYSDEAPFYSGYLSSLGMLLWSTAAAICLFTALTLVPSTEARREARGFLATLGLLTAILLIDDLFMVHEAIYQLTGKSQKRVVLIQGVVLAWMLARYRTTIWRSTNWVLLGSAMGMFAGSLAVDFDVIVLFPRFHHLFEDGFKLLGLFGWWGYAVGCGLTAVWLAGDAKVAGDLPLTASATEGNTSRAEPHSRFRYNSSHPPVRAS